MFVSDTKWGKHALSLSHHLWDTHTHSWLGLQGGREKHQVLLKYVMAIVCLCMVSYAWMLCMPTTAYVVECHPLLLLYIHGYVNPVVANSNNKYRTNEMNSRCLLCKIFLLECFQHNKTRTLSTELFPVGFEAITHSIRICRFPLVGSYCSTSTESWDTVSIAMHIRARQCGLPTF